MAKWNEITERWLPLIEEMERLGFEDYALPELYRAELQIIGGYTMEFELKITTAEGKNKVVKWSGKDGEDAALRYADCHRGATVYATRPIRHGLFVVADTRRMRDS